MQDKSIRVVSRSVAALAMGMALTVGGASLASASPFHDGGGGKNCASGKVSTFDYQSVGTGGYVTAVTPTSVTVQSRNDTTTTYTLTSATTYTEGTTAATATALVVGDRVQIGVSSSEPTTATSVTIELAELFGTVSAVNGDSISITDYQGFTRNIEVSGSTTYSQGGAAAALTDVVVGSKIIAQGTVDTNGTTLDASTVEIGTSGQIKFVYGTITAVTSSSVTVQAKDGTSTTFSYTTSTDVKAIGDPSATLTTSDLAVGEHVGVTYDTSAATTAMTLTIRLAHLSGTVTAVSGDNITVHGPQGFTRMILVGSATTYSTIGASATLADVVVGAKIRAEGVVDANGTTLDALTVEIRPAVTPTPTGTSTPTGSSVPAVTGSSHNSGKSSEHHSGRDSGRGSERGFEKGGRRR